MVVNFLYIMSEWATTRELYSNRSHDCPMARILLVFLLCSLVLSAQSVYPAPRSTTTQQSKSTKGHQLRRNSIMINRCFAPSSEEEPKRKYSSQDTTQYPNSGAGQGAVRSLSSIQSPERYTTDLQSRTCRINGLRSSPATNLFAYSSCPLAAFSNQRMSERERLRILRLRHDRWQRVEVDSEVASAERVSELIGLNSRITANPEVSLASRNVRFS